ncbi:hypothetical protein [Streptomyces sp. JJ38]|uniref:hypothetical protein n=1 Tax=Streptomyces sp. JJ38 TaxID=2738128 RepID=UPI001C58243B|nr:hypothetical protein [Streptomyces sp. JJ38]MBW1596394.1 hypothetical protein [Streptomyces sp. JJ38]
MILLRTVATGLLAGGACVLIVEPRGEGVDHLRLALLTGLMIGQFLALPVALVAGGVVGWLAKGRARPRQRLDSPLGGLLLACGVLLFTQAWMVLEWLDVDLPPDGIGDPDGEVGIGLMSGASGTLMALLGLALLRKGLTASRSAAARPAPAGSPPR